MSDDRIELPWQALGKETSSYDCGDGLVLPIVERTTISAAAFYRLPQVQELVRALEKIAGGYTDSDAPDMTTCTPEQFRSGMWGWSQRVARAALAKVKAAAESDIEQHKEASV